MPVHLMTEMEIKIARCPDCRKPLDMDDDDEGVGCECAAEEEARRREKEYWDEYAARKSQYHHLRRS